MHCVQPFPFSQLPPEIVFHVFAFACNSSTQACLSLCRVSSWTRKVALPCLLRTVTLLDGPSIIAFYTYITHPSLSLYCDYHTLLVRNLWITNGYSQSYIRDIVPRCSNLTRIALTHYALWTLATATTTYHSSIPTIKFPSRNLRITLLGADYAHLWLEVVTNMAMLQPSMRSPVFEMITHLRFTHANSYEVQLQIQHFPRLTHFAIPFSSASHIPLSSLQLPGPFHLFERLLRSRSLECFVLLLYPDISCSRGAIESWIKRTRAVDTRVYFLSYTCSFSQSEWQEEVEGGCGSLWDKASKQTLEFDHLSPIPLFSHLSHN